MYNSWTYLIFFVTISDKKVFIVLDLFILTCTNTQEFFFSLDIQIIYIE